MDHQGRSEGFSRSNDSKTRTRIASCRHLQRVSLILITITLPCDVLQLDASHQQYTCSVSAIHATCTVVLYLTVRDHKHQFGNVSYADMRCYVATLLSCN